MYLQLEDSLIAVTGDKSLPEDKQYLSDIIVKQVIEPMILGNIQCINLSLLHT